MTLSINIFANSLSFESNKKKKLKLKEIYQILYIVQDLEFKILFYFDSVSNCTCRTKV